MVEYTVDILVHLYDSLNEQIESAKSDIAEYLQTSFNLTFSDETRAEVKATRTKAEKRLEKLISIRDNIEELLNKILKIEVTEVDNLKVVRTK